MRSSSDSNQVGNEKASLRHKPLHDQISRDLDLTNGDMLIIAAIAEKYFPETYDKLYGNREERARQIESSLFAF